MVRAVAEARARDAGKSVSDYLADLLMIAQTPSLPHLLKVGRRSCRAVDGSAAMTVREPSPSLHGMSNSLRTSFGCLPIYSRRLRTSRTQELPSEVRFAEIARLLLQRAGEGSHSPKQRSSWVQAGRHCTNGS